MGFLRNIIGQKIENRIKKVTKIYIFILYEKNIENEMIGSRDDNNGREDDRRMVEN